MNDCPVCRKPILPLAECLFCTCPGRLKATYRVWTAIEVRSVGQDEFDEINLQGAGQSVAEFESYAEASAFANRMRRSATVMLDVASKLRLTGENPPAPTHLRPDPPPPPPSIAQIAQLDHRIELENEEQYLDVARELARHCIPFLGEPDDGLKEHCYRYIYVYDSEAPAVLRIIEAVRQSDANSPTREPPPTRRVTSSLEGPLVVEWEEGESVTFVDAQFASTKPLNELAVLTIHLVDNLMHQASASTISSHGLNWPLRSPVGTHLVGPGKATLVAPHCDKELTLTMLKAAGGRPVINQSKVFVALIEACSELHSRLFEIDAVIVEERDAWEAFARALLDARVAAEP